MSEVVQVTINASSRKDYLGFVFFTKKRLHPFTRPIYKLTKKGATLDKEWKKILKSVEVLIDVVSEGSSRDYFVVDCTLV